MAQTDKGEKDARVHQPQAEKEIQDAMDVDEDKVGIMSEQRDCDILNPHKAV